MRVIAIVGMPGSGKGEVANIFKESGFFEIRFGDVTDEEIKKRGLKLNEENERKVREDLRKKYGMDAYVKLNETKIDNALKKSNVAIDGLYSMEEYLYLKKKYGNNLIVIGVYASPETRQRRLMKRKIRPLTPEECESRDIAEIMNLNKGGPIALADFTTINEGSLKELKANVKRIIGMIK